MSKYDGCRTGLKRFEKKVQAEKYAKELEADGVKVTGVKNCDRCHYGWHVHVKNRSRLERRRRRGR